MIHGGRFRFWTLAILSLPVQAAGAESLRHDLFARPQLATLAQAKSEAGNTGGDPEATWSPRLTAVMVAGERSLAAVDGTVVRVGEQVDGYTLLHVRDSTAVFIKNQEWVILEMPGASDTGTSRSGK